MYPVVKRLMTVLIDTVEDTEGSKMGQAGSRRAHAAEPRVPSQVSLFTICGGEVWKYFWFRAEHCGFTVS